MEIMEYNYIVDFSLNQLQKSSILSACRKITLIDGNLTVTYLGDPRN